MPALTFNVFFMQLIDTHAHIYLSEFDLNRKSIIDDAGRNGIGQILMPAIDSTLR